MADNKRVFSRTAGGIISEHRRDGQSCYFIAKTDLTEEQVEALVSEGTAVYITDGADDVTIQVTANKYFSFADERGNKYPPIVDQLDQIFHEGIDTWKETIQAVKDAHPKPE